MAHISTIKTLVNKHLTTLIVMNRILSILLFLLISATSFAQLGITDALKQIEANNPTIKALQAQTDNVKASLRSNNTPPNPSIEGGRFPAANGTEVKYAWGVSQSFEFPTVYSLRNQLAKASDILADASYNAARQDELVNAQITIIELIHAKVVLREVQNRESFAQKMLQIIEKKVGAGNATSLDINKAKLKLVEEAQNVKHYEAKVNLLKSKLLMLNGGNQLPIAEGVLLNQPLEHKDTILSRFKQNDPRYASLEQTVEVAMQNKRLVKHQGLPNLNIGYQSEQTNAEHFSGFKAGISIPLWGNSGARRAATVNLSTVQTQEHSQRLMLEMEFEEYYLETLSLKLQLGELQEALKGFNNLHLLQKALEAGQVSTIEFFNEVTFLYDITDKVLALELDYAKSHAMLHKFEL